MAYTLDDLLHCPALLRRIWAHLFRRNKPDPQDRLAQYFVFNEAIGQVITHTDQESVLLESLCSLAVQSTSVALAWVCRFENDDSLRTLADAGETGYLDSFEERRMGLPVDEGPLLRV
jgi:hypothetical protein